MTDSRLLHGKIALITGSSRGIGAALARGFSEEGATVVLNCIRNRDRAESLLQEIRQVSPDSCLQPFDVSKRASVQRAVKELVGRYGRIDILINNAGILESRPLLEIDDPLLDNTLAVNLKGALYCIQEVVPHMSRAVGSIINVSSISEHSPFPNSAHYAMSKAGVKMLSRCAALELADRQIRVNTLIPGIISTDIDPAYRDKRLMQRMKRIIPLQRIGEPADLVGAAVFLASDSARYITGTEILVDGGFMLFAEKNPPV